MLHVTMADTTNLLLAASMFGSIDVFWFHLWRLRLYRRPGSVAEEAAHLAGYALFIAIAVALLTADTRIIGSIGFTTVLMAIEAGLFSRALLARRRHARLRTATI